jgi:hypothetical protein
MGDYPIDTIPLTAYHRDGDYSNMHIGDYIPNIVIVL